jgi:23S rRNA (cytidine1920-2'-O)/16S rRNA (cytidine1409-2'-O)-methyltransferase
VKKASEEIPLDARIAAAPAHPYVSRGGVKLAAALDHFGYDPHGHVCLDGGASTGGFTQVLLERGAARVYAVDVGHGQLHERLRADPRVTCLEGVDGRSLDRATIPDPIDLLVCDASFVSVVKILEAPLRLCAPGAEAAILVKPQFEAGREHVGKGGIVSDEAAIAGAVGRVVGWFGERGWQCVVALPSPIAGGDGNRETIAVFRSSPPVSAGAHSGKGG